MRFLVVLIAGNEKEQPYEYVVFHHSRFRAKEQGKKGLVFKNHDFKDDFFKEIILFVHDIEKESIGYFP